MEDKNSPKIANEKLCEICNYKCSKKSDYDKHILTAKHTRMTKCGQNFAKIANTKFVCYCGKEYKHRQGLWKHSKVCQIPDETPIYFSNNEELLQAVLKDNQEFKQLLIEQNAKIIELASKNTELASKNTVINNTTNNNSTTNNFNLQMFLNVQCKDALNITDFVDSLQLQIKDLEDTGRVGYVNGIAKIFLNGLNCLDISHRPIHCSDLKRETIYIKDKDIWEKENDERNKLKLAIKTIASKNIKQIPIWQKQNPEYNDSSSKKNDQYLKIVSNAMNGLTEDETKKNYDKIISKLAKEVVIQKDSN
jgi:hypothetical protein